MNLTRENYYDYGKDGDEVIVSNSSLTHINPAEGGSLKRFLNYVTNQIEEKESKYLERGKLLHRYLEDPEKFTISPDDKPSIEVCNILEVLRTEIKLSGRTPGELIHHTDELIQVARLKGFATHWGSETIIRRIREKGDAYFKHLNGTDGKIMTDAATKVILDNIIDGLKTDEYTKENYIDNPPGVMKELPILFHHEDFTCKALLDNVFIDFDEQEVKIRDVKTTSKPVNLYMGNHVTVLPFTEGIVTFPGAFQKYHTHRQLGFYNLAIRAWLEQQSYDASNFTFEHEVLVCETVEPYEHVVYQISHNWIAAGKEEVKSCMISLHSEPSIKKLWEPRLS